MRKKVVSLILEDNGKILVEKRKLTKKTNPGKIVFPGGHVEQGESMEQAIKREVKEELDIELNNLEIVYHSDYDGPEEKQKIYWFKCSDYKGEIKNLEAEKLIWIEPTDINLLSYEVSREALRVYLKIN